MAIGLTAIGAGLYAAAPYIYGAALAGAATLPYVSSGIRRFKRWRSPQHYRRQDVLKRIGITPEQYELRAQNLEQALRSMQSPQSVFQPRQAQMQQEQDIRQQLPQGLGGGQAAAQRPGGLMQLLRALEGGARGGYEEDLARIGARRGPVRNPVGRTSGTLGLQRAALMNRMTGLEQSRMQMLANYANRSGMADIEATGLNMQREEGLNRIQDFAQQARRQQLTGQQAQFLGQQQYNIGQTGLQNIAAGEQQRLGTRQLRVGQQDPYRVNPVAAPPVEGV